MSTPTNRQVNIYINQASAERSLENLQKKADKLNIEIDQTRQSAEDLTKNIEKLADSKKDLAKLSREAENLSFEIKEGEKAGKDMTAEMKTLAGTEKDIRKLTRSSEDLKKSIEKGKTAVDSLKKSTTELAEVNGKIDTLSKTITGSMAPSFNMVKARVFELRRELEGMSKDAPGYAQKFEDFKKVTGRFTEMQSEIRNVGKALDDTEKKGESFLDKVKAIALGTVIGNTTQAILEKVGGYFSGIVSGNAKLSDSLADVRKATGLTDAEVKTLNSSLGKIDTRTATEELRNIAIGLGQIGEQATQGAVAAIDKIVVALGDEFGGGAQEITTTLGVLRNNLQDIKTNNYGDDVLHIGNALNVLGAEGLATAPVVVDFANRLSGIAGTFKVTSGQILGLSAAMQEMGIPAERGSTAVTRLLQSIASDTDKFAKVAKYAGVSGKEFADLVNNDIVAALTKVAEGAKKAGADNQTFGKILKDLDADGSGAGEVLSKIAANATLVSNKITLAGNALKETSSISGEFDLKNTNMAAQLEKLEKAFSKLITSPAVNNFVAKAVDVAVDFVKVLGDMFSFLSNNTKALSLWALAWLLNTSYIKSFTASLKVARAETLLSTIAQTAARSSSLALALAKATLTGNVTKMAQAWRLLTATMKVNPLVLLLTVAGAAVLAMDYLIGKTEKLTAAEKEAAAVQLSIIQSAGQELGQLELLKQRSQNVALSYDERAAAAKKLQELYPAIFGNLKIEEILAGKVADAYQRATKAIIARASTEAYNKQLGELTSKMQDAGDKAQALADKLKIPLEKQQGLNGSDLGFKIDYSQPMPGALAEKLEQYNRFKIQQGVLIDRILAAQKEGEEAIAGSGATVTTPKGPVYTSATDDKAKAAADKSAARDAKEAATRVQRMEEYNAKIRQLRDDLLASGDSKDALELQKIRDQFTKLKEEGKQYYKDVEKELQLSELEKEAIRQKIAEQADKQAEKGYKDTLQKADDYYEQRKQQAGQAYLDGTTNQDQYNKEILRLEEQEARSRAIIAEGYAGTSTKAAKDVEEAKTKALKKGIEDRARTEKQNEKDKITTAETAVIVAPRGSNAEFEAQKALLKIRYEAEIKNANDIATEKAKIDAQYQRDSVDLEKQFLLAKANEYIDYAQKLTSIIGAAVDYFNQRDQQQIDSDKAANDIKKKNLQKRYDAGKISKASYDKQIAKLDEESDKKEKELKLKQFKRNKALSLAQAVINTAQAITAALAAPWPASIAFAALAGIAGAFQIAAIASSKPPEFAKGRRPVGQGGVPEGPSHADDGIKLINSQTGEVVGEMEGQEPILSVATYENNKEVIDKLLDSSMYGGGKRIAQPSYMYAQPRSLNSGKVTETMQYISIYRNGGFAQSPTTSSAAPASGSVQAIPLDAMVAILQKLDAKLDDGFKGSVYWNEVDEKNKQMALLQKAGSFNAIA